MPDVPSWIRLLFILPYIVLRYRADWLHTQYVAPPIITRRCFVTIHDILYERYPQYFPLLFVLRSKLLIRFSARHARHIFTVSAFSKKEIMSTYSIDEEKISVIPNGVSLDRFTPGTDNSALLQRFGLSSKRYILTVGRLEPRKNLVGLLRAYRRIGSEALPLVIIGQKDFGYREAFDLLEDPWFAEKVKVFSNLNDGELPILYRNALMFVYPSWAEGFGMPPLEAMASGIPVIVSNSTALPEVVGDAGILIDPKDIKGICSAIETLEKNDEYRKILIEKGLRQAASFSWDTSAVRLGNVYRKNPKFSPLS